VRRRVAMGFTARGETVVLLGATRDELGGSEWAQHVHGHLGGLPPRVDLAAERALGRLMAEVAAGSLVTAGHDVSDGGLVQTLVEMVLRCGVGATVAVDGDPFVALFSESVARAVVSVPAAAVDDLLARAASYGVPATVLGRTGGDSLVVADAFEVGVDELRTAHEGTLPALFG
jgi:phosphoribosylformylglycinamidine (FGAM) synthase-like enzyme